MTGPLRSSVRGNLFSASLVSQVTSYIKPRSLGGCCLQFFPPTLLVRLQNKDILKLGLSVMKLKGVARNTWALRRLGGSYLRVLFRSVTGRQAAPPGCSHGCSDPSLQPRPSPAAGHGCSCGTCPEIRNKLFALKCPHRPGMDLKSRGISHHV